MKLLSVNMEGKKHLDRITELITTQNPDCICLQEAPEVYSKNLESLGYTTVFAEMGTATQNEQPFTIGIIIASKLPFTHHTNYYATIGTSDAPVTIGTRSVAMKYAYIFAELSEANATPIRIATTHMVVTHDGSADEYQTHAMQHMLALLGNEQPHILCGDFNMPRGYNNLYELVTSTYTDTIPLEYTSSLDRSLHRLGNKTDLNAPIFDSYMVDYIFSQPPYITENVRLQFGVSDHAAVIADITLKE